jgi:hypothetical protein
MTAIPVAGDWIRTDHHCWWPGSRTAPTYEHPATLHNAPIKVDRVVKLKDGRSRIEATRCDGSPIHLIVDVAGNEVLTPWDEALVGYEIVPAPESVTS